MRSDKARRRLEQERERLQSILDDPSSLRLRTSQEDDSGELSSFDQHPADSGSDTVDREQALSVVEGAAASLAEINEAIERLEAGEYGVCERCGERIPDERLAARPETRYCVTHQAELERTL